MSGCSCNKVQGVYREADVSGGSDAVAAEGGSTHDKGSGDVVGGELDAISISSETEKPDAQRQDGDEVRRRREDAGTMERKALKQKLVDVEDVVAARREFEQWLAEAMRSVATMRAQALVDRETLRRTSNGRTRHAAGCVSDETCRYRGISARCPSSA